MLQTQAFWGAAALMVQFIMLQVRNCLLNAAHLAAVDFEKITLVLFGEREFGVAGEIYGEFVAFTTASAF